jgi:hypothetical protein
MTNLILVTLLSAEESVEEKLSLESENKVFHFDRGENKRGDYLRISEVGLWSCFTVIGN